MILKRMSAGNIMLIIYIDSGYKILSGKLLCDLCKPKIAFTNVLHEVYFGTYLRYSQIF